MSNDPAPTTAVITVRDPDTQALARTIDSIRRQTRPPEEIILADTSKSEMETPSFLEYIHLPGYSRDQARQIAENQGTKPTVFHIPQGTVLDQEATENALDHVERGGVEAIRGRTEYNTSSETEPFRRLISRRHDDPPEFRRRGTDAEPVTSSDVLAQVGLDQTTRQQVTDAALAGILGGLFAGFGSAAGSAFFGAFAGTVEDSAAAAASTVE